MILSLLSGKYLVPKHVTFHLEHDRLLASASHAPHIVAAALAMATPLKLIGLLRRLAEPLE